MTPQQPLTFIR
ncbi:Protein of unknown function [Bacillus mycoides]|uniref:Uncharacterized protein n=1 Tax=Bacillus mycoides TaxID=1405 RepID=A0A1C4FHT5_BACMY|nr:Protein of unknown function [Bacillus mycoides]SCC55549.1 Protein of unknown function [Bacillus mycoides]SCM88907.1 Protein of unknown function [Bacillus mycoides]